MEGPLDLGIHTEMISDGAMRAIERGVVTGNRKTLHRGKVVITFALGSEALYEYLNNNPFIEAHPVDYVNDPFIVGQNDNLVAINSAIEIDLTGQVCSDSIGARIYSGFGGQVDFIRGAARSKGGKPVIALPSTRPGGQDVAHRPLPEDGGRRGDEPRRRPLGRDGVRRGEPVREEPEAARRGAHRDRPPRLPGRAGAGREGAEAPRLTLEAGPRPPDDTPRETRT